MNVPEILHAAYIVFALLKPTRGRISFHIFGAVLRRNWCLPGVLASLHLSLHFLVQGSIALKKSGGMVMVFLDRILPRSISMSEL